MSPTDENELRAERWRWVARFPLLLTAVSSLLVLLYAALVGSTGDSGLYLALAVAAPVLLGATLILAVAVSGRPIKLEGQLSRKLRWQKDRSGIGAIPDYAARRVENIAERELMISGLRRDIQSLYALTAWSVLAFAAVEGASIYVLYGHAATAWTFTSAIFGTWLATALLATLVARQFGDHLTTQSPPPAAAPVEED